MSDLPPFVKDEGDEEEEMSLSRTYSPRIRYKVYEPAIPPYVFPSPPPQEKQKRRPTSTEVVGQCSKCLDLFSVVVRIKRGRTLDVDLTARLEWQDGTHTTLLHRPSYCNAPVRLFGTVEHLYEY